ncbi:threonine-phosphate decarboxylase CobD [Marinobacter sp. 1Y8]
MNGKGITVADSRDRLEHGGRLGEAVRRWQKPRHEWLDLSTGINPMGWPVPDVPASVWQRLPEDDDGLELEVRRWSGAPPSAGCAPVSGSQAAIQTLPKLRKPCRVGVPVPGYEEHAHCWARAGHDVVPVPLETIIAGVDNDESWLASLDVLVWINPNNPTGIEVSQDRLSAWHDRLASRGGWLVIDEAFMTDSGGESLLPVAGKTGLVVLRSLGKFFGLAGLRAGAVIGDPEITDRLTSELGPWAMSGPARYLMARALTDQRWQTETTERLAGSGSRLQRLLENAGLTNVSGTNLFRYCAFQQAEAFADTLAREGILVRRFEDPRALRFGLPGTEDEWQRLSSALEIAQQTLARNGSGTSHV